MRHRQDPHSLASPLRAERSRGGLLGVQDRDVVSGIRVASTETRRACWEDVLMGEHDEVACQRCTGGPERITMALHPRCMIP